LHRGYADIEYNGVNFVDARLGKPFVHFRKAGGVEGESTPTPRCKVGTCGKRIGIAIESMNARTRSQDSLAVSACTKGAIHNI
jgi:hypothetical protein